MLWNKENRCYSLICLIMAVAVIYIEVRLGLPVLACVITGATIFFSFIAGEITISVIYRNIRDVRIKTDNIVKYNTGAKKRMLLSSSKADEKNEAYISGHKGVDRYQEGELGKLADSVASLVDILSESEQKQLREKEFLRDMISDISHQLKTPIAALVVFNDIFMENEGIMGTEERKDILLQSEQQLERMKWLVQAMLQLARIEACSIDFSKKRINVKSFLESCSNMLLSKAKEKNQLFEIQCNDDIYADTDPEWLQEAVVNVIKNSIDYAPAESKIILGAKQTPIATRIWIKDFGPGIEEKDRINIFKRFYRAQANTVNPNSVGIGLALAKSIVEGCGGSIRVESLPKSQCSRDEQSYTEMIITI